MSKKLNISIIVDNDLIWSLPLWEKTIPILIKSKTDFIGLAQTGTGKTAAFGLPILHHIDAKSENIQALIFGVV